MSGMMVREKGYEGSGMMVRGKGYEGRGMRVKAVLLTNNINVS